MTLMVTGQGLVTGMATVVVLVLLLVTLVARKAELLQSSSHHSGALVLDLPLAVVVVVDLALVQPLPQWSKLPLVWI